MKVSLIDKIPKDYFVQCPSCSRWLAPIKNLRKKPIGLVSAHKRTCQVCGRRWLIYVRGILEEQSLLFVYTTKRIGGPRI